MPQPTVSPESLRTSAWILDHFGVSRLTLRRWLERPDIGFPAPAMRIAGVRYWRVADVLAFEASRQVVENAA